MFAIATKETFNAGAVQAVLEEASLEARTAAVETHKALGGDRGACGFAWVNVWGVRSNSRLGKTLMSAGFRKDYTGALCLWNPSKAGVQSLDILEAGAYAYAKVLQEKLGLDRVYAGSRMD